jgi:hypothetical protein
MESDKQIVKKSSAPAVKKITSIFSEKKEAPKKVEEGLMGFGYGAGGAGGDDCCCQPSGQPQNCCGCC